MTEKNFGSTMKTDFCDLLCLSVIIDPKGKKNPSSRSLQKITTGFFYKSLDHATKRRRFFSEDNVLANMSNQNSLQIELLMKFNSEVNSAIRTHLLDRK